MADNSLYFIALVPRDHLFDDLADLKKQLSEEYATRAALRSPPHITLHMPFRFRSDREELLCDSMENLPVRPFEVTLNGFGSFPPRVIFVQPQPTDEMDTLHDEICDRMKKKHHIFNAKYKDRPFRPHLTLAFRDLKKMEFYRCWEKMKDESFLRQWTVNDIVILKHTGSEWEILKRILLGK